MDTHISYDSNLTESAKRFRNNATKAENKIWYEVLNNKKLKGYKFTRQKPIDYYILDFYCSKLMLGIEIDGKIHEKLVERDAERTMDIESFGIKIIRYKNEEVLEDLKTVRDSLLRQVEIREQELKF